MAFAIRGLLKLPTANDDDEGVGTGKMDFAFDAIVSKEVNERVEFSGYGGYIFRGSPDDVEIANGFRYGFGIGMPSRKSLRLTAEIHGEAYSDDTVTLSRSLIGEDGSIAPASTDNDSPFVATIGLTWQGKGGVFAGAGLNWRMGMDGRSEFGAPYEDDDRRLARLPVPPGLSPRRTHLRAATTAANRRRRQRRRRWRTARRP